MGNRKIIYRAILAVFISLGLFVGLSQFGLFGKFTATLEITNSTTTDITELEIVIYEDLCKVNLIAPNETETCRFEIYGDSHYKISWKDGSGKLYREELGYVTSGFNYKHKLVFIGRGKVKFDVIEAS